MADKVFVILASQDREVMLEVGLAYPLNASKNAWMKEVKIILFGPSEKLAVNDKEVQDRLREAMSAGIHVMACNWCADRMGIADDLEALGLEVVQVGSVISELLKEGRASLTFQDLKRQAGFDRGRN